MNVSENRRMRPEQILEMFLEVLNQHASKSYDFPISDLLSQYMHGRLVPNFPEAAMVINSAGQVYSRKVDYLEALLMAMHDKQNAPDRNDKPDNPDGAEKPTTEKKRPGKRLKNVDHSSTIIQLASPKQIKKSTSSVEKINLNSSETGDVDRFKNYCQAVKSKVPVFYERVNLVISDKTDSYFDGSRPISRDDPDCQKNYNVFVGCISFKEKQMMSQREFMNRIQFDNLEGGFDSTNANSPAVPEFDNPHAEINNMNEPTESTSNVAGDNNESDLPESTLLQNSTFGINDDCDSAIVDDLNSMVDDTILNGTLAIDSTINESQVINSTVNNSETTGINESEVFNSTVNNSETTGLNESEVFNSTVNNSETNGINESEVANSTVNTSEITGLNESEVFNSTVNNSETGMLSQSETTVAESTVNDTLNATEALDSTQEATKIDDTNLTNNDTAMDSISSKIDETTLTNGTANDEALMDSTCVDEKSITDSQLDANVTIIGTDNETLEPMQNNSSDSSFNGLGGSGNIFRINEEYLKLDEVFRLPLSVLQHEIDIKLNIFGIPFGRLRRQVKFALPKDFDYLRTGIKRTRDIDECSITTTSNRKFVKLNDGSATPSIEASSTMPVSTSVCDPDSSIVPAPDTNSAETPLEATSQPIDETSLRDGISAECSAGENAPKDDEQSITQTTLENPSQAVDDVVKESQESQENPSQQVDDESHIDATEDFGTSDSLTNDDGPSLPKIQRIDDASSIFDSGIGTEGSQCGTEGTEGTITNRRDTLDLTPPSEQIENEMSAEADEQSANRIQEMTNLSEKVHSWHQRLKPILLHSEKRNDFDVKETSRNIVECFPSEDSSFETKAPSNRLISFENIMERRDKADTARYFFSMLQMANNRNIELIVHHNDSSKLCPQNKIMLKLLNPNIREIDPNIEKN